MEAEHTSGVRQLHPCTCGPASVALAFKALGAAGVKEDNFLSEKFKQWLPVGEFLTRGFALHELQLVAEVIGENRFEIRLRRAFSENRSLFEQDLKAAVSEDDQVVVINFTQASILNTEFGTQGDPHFSPICGYDPVLRSIKVADVDQDIQSIYTRTFDQIYRAMETINPAFGLPRGWLRIKKRRHEI